MRFYAYIDVRMEDCADTETAEQRAETIRASIAKEHSLPDECVTLREVEDATWD